jgi:GAF domain-containing protein
MASELQASVIQLSAATTLATVAAVVRTAARRITGAEGATFVLRDNGMCFYADEDAIAPLWKGQRFPMAQCISGWAMLNRQPATVPDIERDARIPSDVYRSTFVRSLVMVPIRRADPLGAIGAYWSTVREPAGEEIAALEQLAEASADVIDRLGMDSAPWAPNFAIWQSTSNRAPEVANGRP